MAVRAKVQGKTRDLINIRHGRLLSLLRNNNNSKKKRESILVLCTPYGGVFRKISCSSGTVHSNYFPSATQRPLRHPTPEQ